MGYVIYMHMPTYMSVYIYIHIDMGTVCLKITDIAISYYNIYAIYIHLYIYICNHMYASIFLWSI